MSVSQICSNHPREGGGGEGEGKGSGGKRRGTRQERGGMQVEYGSTGTTGTGVGGTRYPLEKCTPPPVHHA